MFKEAQLTNLEVSTSDHSPLFLVPEVGLYINRRPVFRFEDALLREPVCYKLVEDVGSSSSESFSAKLTQYSELLSAWDKEVTGSFKG